MIKNKAFMLAFFSVLIFVSVFVFKVGETKQAHSNSQQRTPAMKQDHCYQKALEKLAPSPRKQSEEGRLLFAVLCLES